MHDVALLLNVLPYLMGNFILLKNYLPHFICLFRLFSLLLKLKISCAFISQVPSLIEKNSFRSGSISTLFIGDQLLQYNRYLGTDVLKNLEEIPSEAFEMARHMEASLLLVHLLILIAKSLYSNVILTPIWAGRLIHNTILISLLSN